LVVTVGCYNLLNMYRQVDDILEKTSGIAYYRQISEILMQNIEGGDYAPGSQLPTESDLSRQFGVNRHTAREALKLLKHEGVIYSIKGKGNFVADAKIKYRVSKKVRFTSSITEAGLAPGKEMVEKRLVAADSLLAEKLGLDAGEPVIRLKMLRFASGTPLMLATSHLSAARFVGLVDEVDASYSLYELIREKYGVETSRAESVFETVMPAEEHARLLQMAPEVPLLVSKSIAKDQYGKIVEYCETMMRGDIGSIVISFE
jgi:phosphonate metabolism transcriptional regulator PhnF